MLLEEKGGSTSACLTSKEKTESNEEDREERIFQRGASIATGIEQHTRDGDGGGGVG